MLQREKHIIRKSESGNVLFLILIAVVLFAALSYAVTSSSRMSAEPITQKDRLAASQILGFFADVDRGLTKLQTMGGLVPEQIGLENTFIPLNRSYSSVSEPNANCTVDSCKLFKPSGGGVAFQNFEKYAASYETQIADGVQPSWVTGGYYEFRTAAVQDVGTSLPDVWMRLNEIDRNVCNALLDILGLTSSQVMVGASGTYSGGYPISNWNSSTYVFNIGTIPVDKRNILVSRSGTGKACYIYKLLFAR